jgi:SAM-dependent methyltransferase
LGKYYFNCILKNLIKFGNLKKEKGIILDYGCGVGRLKKKLGKNNIIGYDIIPELSEIDDFTKIKPVKIILSGVLEHMRLNEIEGLLCQFMVMNPTAELLVYLPTENFISKIAMILNGMKNAHDDHISKYTNINKMIEKYYFPEKRKYIYLRMAQITKYAPLKTRNGK